MPAGNTIGRAAGRLAAPSTRLLGTIDANETPKNKMPVSVN
jgi:hypothetical protein